MHKTQCKPTGKCVNSKGVSGLSFCSAHSFVPKTGKHLEERGDMPRLTFSKLTCIKFTTASCSNDCEKDVYTRQKPTGQSCVREWQRSARPDGCRFTHSSIAACSIFFHCFFVAAISLHSWQNHALFFLSMGTVVLVCALLCTSNIFFLFQRGNKCQGHLSRDSFRRNSFRHVLAPNFSLLFFTLPPALP